MTTDIDTLLRLAEEAQAILDKGVGAGDLYILQDFQLHAHPAAIIALCQRLERAEKSLCKIKNWGAFTMPHSPSDAMRQIAREGLGE